MTSKSDACRQFDISKDLSGSARRRYCWTCAPPWGRTTPSTRPAPDISRASALRSLVPLHTVATPLTTTVEMASTKPMLGASILPQHMIVVTDLDVWNDNLLGLLCSGRFSCSLQMSPVTHKKTGVPLQDIASTIKASASKSTYAEQATCKNVPPCDATMAHDCRVHLVYVRHRSRRGACGAAKTAASTSMLDERTMDAQQASAAPRRRSRPWIAQSAAPAARLELPEKKTPSREHARFECARATSAVSKSVGLVVGYSHETIKLC